MSQAATWGVPRSGEGVAMTTYAERDDESLDAILSRHKGPSAPAYATAGALWVDDATDPVWIEKVYDGSAWIPVRLINATDNFARSSDCYLGTAGGTGAAVTLSTAFGLTAYYDGQRFLVKMPAANTSGALTLNVDSIGAKSVKLPSGSNPAASQLASGAFVEVVYNATTDTLVVLGGAEPVVSAFAVTLLDDADAAAVLTTLGVSAFVQTILNDANGAAVLATIGGLALAGGTLTGDLVLADGAPSSQFSAGFRGAPVNSQDVSYILTKNDVGRAVRHNSASAHAYTIPPSTDVTWSLGDTIVLFNINSGVVTITRGSGVALRQWGSATNANIAMAQHGNAVLFYGAGNNWYASGAGLS